MARKGSETTDELLRNYEIGEKVRALRLRRKMGLVELGNHTGLSPGLLSKIENSRLFPPLQTLVRIALVFGVGLDHFFTDEASRRVVAVVRKEDRQSFPELSKKKPVSYTFESLDFKANDRRMDAYLAEFNEVDPDEAQTHAHDGAELIFVIEGTLGLRIGREDYEIGEEDSVYFDSDIEHGYRRIGKKRCRAIIVTTR